MHFVRYAFKNKCLGINAISDPSRSVQFSHTWQLHEYLLSFRDESVLVLQMT